jgi:hypothetical protein
MKASDVSDRLRQVAGKRDHREVLSDAPLVLRPGPNFDWLMGSPVAGQATPSAPEQDPAGGDRREAADHAGEGEQPDPQLNQTAH